MKNYFRFPFCCCFLGFRFSLKTTKTTSTMIHCAGRSDRNDFLFTWTRILSLSVPLRSCPYLSLSAFVPACPSQSVGFLFGFFVNGNSFEAETQRLLILARAWEADDPGKDKVWNSEMSRLLENLCRRISSRHIWISINFGCNFSYYVLISKTFILLGKNSDYKPSISIPSIDPSQWLIFEMVWYFTDGLVYHRATILIIRTGAIGVDLYKNLL